MIIKKMRLSMAITALAGSVLMTNPAQASEKKTEQEKQQQSKSKYANKAVADIYSNTTLNIRKKGNLDAEIVGKLKKGNIATVIKKGDQWSKVKSGNVTGYVNNDYLVFGDDIEDYAEKNVKQVAKVTTETLRVREKASTKSDVITLVSEDETYKVKKTSDDWAKVSIDGKTGYISKEYADVKYSFGRAKSMKEIQEEEQKKKEEQAAKEAALKSSSSTSSSSDTASNSSSSNEGSQTSSNNTVSASAISGSSIGQKVVNYAKQFVGNPYRYGGNSLTNGIDCSGFTQQVLSKFGYNISRTSSSQAGEGVSVSTSNLQPGDLLFYGGSGGINHVAMYIGGGQVVHASNSAPYPKGGIKISNAFYRTPVCARRIIH